MISRFLAVKKDTLGIPTWPALCMPELFGVDEMKASVFLNMMHEVDCKCYFKAVYFNDSILSPCLITEKSTGNGGCSISISSLLLFASCVMLAMFSFTL